MTDTRARSCWCGATDFEPFGPDYSRCRSCQTLVSQKGLQDVALNVVDDETDFYGKQYWLAHQDVDLGFPDITRRARADLSERNLHWLKTLLAYRLPPARLLELGCAHGSFVALAGEAGFRSSGVEMSPWVVEFGRRTFGIDVVVGPLERLEPAPHGLDVIAMMDVLEHLPDPQATIGRCVEALRPDGLLLIQTPEFRDDMQFDDLQSRRSPFLDQLKADEHLHLFSRQSVTELLARAGVTQLAFEPAIFAHYDMFLVASRAPLAPSPPEAITESLQATVHGRMVQALLDLRERELRGEADRQARGEQVTQLTAMLAASEADRGARGEQITTLTRLLQESEKDRADRLVHIEDLTKRLLEAQGELETLKRNNGKKRWFS